MADMRCSYDGDRDEALIAYLYEDHDSAERALFGAHLMACAACRSELSVLKGVRAQLARWAPPEPNFVVAGRQSPVVSHGSSVVSWRSWWREVPAWAQVAAALLFLGVAAGIANLEIRYDRNGLAVRTGWSNPVPDGAAQGGSSSLWRADLAALEQRLRTEFRAAGGSPTAASAVGSAQRRAFMPSDGDTLRRVRALIDESERRQQRELALRLADVVREVHSQRQADLVKIDRSLGVIQNSTGMEVMKQRELLNYLVRASQRQ